MKLSNHSSYIQNVIFFATFISFISSGMNHEIFAQESKENKMYIKKDGTKLRATPEAKAKTMKNLDKGTAVLVLEKKKMFLKVSTLDGIKGWVFKFKLINENPIEKEKSFFDFLGKKDPKMAAKESGSGSSIRGLSPMAEEHAKKKGVSPEDIQAVKDMEEFKLSKEEIESFQTKRKLGMYQE